MSDLWSLPQAWSWTTMGAVSEVVGGGTPSTSNPSNFDGSIPWITPADLSGYTGKTISGGSRSLSERGVNESGARWLPKGSVLFSSRAPIGYVAIATQPVTTNQGFKSFVHANGIASEYLYYWLSSAKEQAEELASGTTFLELSGAKAALVPLPLAPEAEQTRIVTKLEELLSDLDAGMAELKAAQQKLAQYRQSLLKAAVEGALTAPWRAAQRKQLSAPLSPRGRGAGGEGANTPATEDETWLQARARELRQQQTPEEHALWQQLRAKRFSGYKFRRQQPLGRFIVDFVCFAKKLIIELDGGQHAEAAEYDAHRDAWLKQEGFRVLRFWNNEWATQPEAVLEAIWSALQEEPPLPNPSPTRGEGLESETGAQLLSRMLSERRKRWEARQLARFAERGKTPPKDWQSKYPEPVPPDTANLPELPEGWVWASVDQCSLDESAITDGPFGSNLKSTHYQDHGPRVIRLQNIGDGFFVDAKAHISESHYSELLKHAVQEDDLVIAMLGEVLPRACIVPNGVGSAIVKADCARVRVNPDLLKPAVLAAQLNSKPIRDVVVKFVKGIGRPRVNLGHVRSVPVALCSMDEQLQVESLLSDAQRSIDRQNEAIELGLKQSSAQRKNILKAAFSGQLVPQDPADEPASTLLARIRAAREAQGTKKPARRRREKELA